MSRPAIALILLVALAATGLIALALLDKQREDRSEKEHASRDRFVTPVEGNGENAERERTKERERTPTAENRGWNVTGFVTSSDGTPIASALVRATILQVSRETMTERDGAYAISLPEPECRFDIFAGGYLPLLGTAPVPSSDALTFRFEGAGPWTRDFELTPAGSIAGRVTGADGRPVAGATVYVIDAQHQLLDFRSLANATTTRPDGTYAFPGLPARVTDVGVKARDFLPALREDITTPAVGRETVDFVLERGRTVRVRVEGADMIGGMVTVFAADSRLRSSLLPPGGVRALSRYPVGRPFVDMPVVGRRAVRDVALQGLGPGAADIWAEMGFRLTETGLGRILDSTASEVTLRLLPYAHVKIRAFDSATGDELEPRVTRLTGDLRETAPYETGSDLVRVPVDTRRHKLLFELEGYESLELALPDMSKADPVPSEEPFALQLDVAMTPHSSDEAKGSFYLLFEPAHKSGRVAVVGRDADGRRRFVLHPEEQDDEGRWLVEKVPVGTYDLTILASGKVPATLFGIGVTSAAKPTHRVALTDGGGIDLKITGPDGKLLEKVHILLRDANERQIDVQIISMVSGGRAFIAVNYLPTVAAARSDSGLAPGSYTLTAAKEGYAPASADFAIQSTEVAEIALTLRPN